MFKGRRQVCPTHTPSTFYNQKVTNIHITCFAKSWCITIAIAFTACFKGSSWSLNSSMSDSSILRLCPEVWLQPSVRPDQWNLDSQGSLCQTRALWWSQFGPSRPPGLLILSPLSGPPPQPYLSTPTGECRAGSCQSACWSAPEGERACRPIQADLPSVHQTVQRQADAAQPPGKEPQLVLASQILVINWQLTNSDGDFLSTESDFYVLHQGMLWAV